MQDQVSVENLEVIADNLLHSHTFPLYIRQAVRAPFTPKSLIRADRTTGIYAKGIWCFREPGADLPSSHWLVIHWEKLLTRLLRASQAERRSPLEVRTRTSLRELLRKAPERRPEVLEHLRDALLRGLPPGVTQPLPPSFAEVLQRKLEGDKDGDKQNPLAPVTVLRLPRLIVSKDLDLSQLLAVYRPLNQNHLRRTNPQLLYHCPIVVRLLHHALLAARDDVPGAGWARWGLLWTPSYLLFNHRTAVTTLLAQPHLTALSGLSEETLLRDRKRVHGDCRHLRGPTLPRLSKMTLHQGHPKNPKQPVLLPSQQRYITAMQGLYDMAPWAGQPLPSYDGEDYTIFPLHGKDTFLQYFDALQTLDSPTALGKSPRYLVSPWTPPELTQAPEVLAEDRPGDDPLPTLDIVRSQPTQAVTLDALTLGYDPSVAAVRARYVPMTVYHRRVRGQHYVSFPSELTRLFTDLRIDTLPALRSLIHRGLAVHEPQGFFYHIDALHPTSPQGEALQFLRTVLETSPEATAEDRTFAFAYITLCAWLHDPTLPEAAHLAYTYLDAAATSGPSPLTTRDLRIQFLRYKGMCVNKPDKRNVTDGNIRSARFNMYEGFVFWFIADTDLQYRDFRLARADYARYVSERWMPWRRPSGNEAYLVEVPGWGPIPGAWAVKQAQQPSSDTSPKYYSFAHIWPVESSPGESPPFTLDRPRTGKKVSRYIHKEDTY